MEVKSQNSTAALMKAAWDGDTGQAQALIDEGVDVNAKDAFGRTALIIAAGQGHTYIVQILLDNGADANAQDRIGATALMAAQARGYYRIVSLLTTYTNDGGEAEVHQQRTQEKKSTPSSAVSLQRAVDNGDVQNVNALIATGADVNARTDDGWTPLMLATIKGHTEVVASLLQQGADVNAKNKKGWTALMFAVSMGDSDTMRVLLEGRAEIDARDNDGKTSLMQAAGENNIESLQILIDSGADVNIMDRLGETALTIAVRRGYTEIVEVLKKAGAMGDTFQAPPSNNPAPGLPHDLMRGADALFNETELQRLKEEIDEFLPQTWPTSTPPAVTPETQALTPLQLSEIGERLISALEALRPASLPPAKPSISIADLSHKIMLTIPEAAALSNLSSNHIRQAIKSGRLKAKIIGRGWRIKRTHLDVYVSAL